MLKRIDFDYNGEMFGAPETVEKTVTVDDLKARKTKFKGLKDSMILEADNDLETLLTVYHMNRNSRNSRKTIVDCLKKMAVVRA